MKDNKKELDYSRLHLLGNKFKEFIDTLPEDNPDFEILMFAHDSKNKVAGTFTLLNVEDERESLVQCIDNCITGSAINDTRKNITGLEIFNGLGEYMMRVCAMFPDLYENFKTGVEKFKKDIK